MLRKPKDSERRNRNRDGGHTYAPTSGVHVHEHQTRNNHSPALERVSTVPSNRKTLSSSPQSPANLGMHSRQSRPFPLHDYTSMEQPHQHPGRNDETRSRSRISHGPAEVSFTSFRPAQEPYETRPGPTTSRPGSKLYEGAPSSRTASRQRRQTSAPLDHIGFASPSVPESLARDQRLEQAAMNARRSASQYTRGFGQPQRERSSYSARESELKRANTHAPGLMSMDANGTGRYRGGQPRFRDV